jgi:hypothetical protein
MAPGLPNSQSAGVIQLYLVALSSAYDKVLGWLERFD